MHVVDDSDVADLCLRIAGTVGKVWKMHRRAIPSDVRDSMRQLLLDLRLHVIPADVIASSAVGKARHDVRGIAELLRVIASRPRIGEKEASSLSFIGLTTLGMQDQSQCRARVCRFASLRPMI